MKMSLGSLLGSLKRFFISLLAATLLVPLAGSSAAVSPPPGIVGWWPGEGDGASLVGGAGTLTGGVGFAPGHVGEAFQFNGSSQYVATGLDAQPAALPATTWEAWVYPTKVHHGTRQQVFSIDTGGHGRSLLIESGTTNFGVFTGSGVWTPVGVTTNEWQHLAVVFTPENIWLYKNGIPFSYGQAPTLRGSSAKLNIGRNPGYGEYFIGAIDEATIYNRALAPEEILEIYAAGSAGKARKTAAAADLAVTQVIVPEPVSIGMGQRLTNTVTVTNFGADAAPSLTLAMEIPPSTTFVSASSSVGSYYQHGNVLYVVLAELPENQAFTAQVIANPTTVGDVTTTTTVSSLATDPVALNNTISTVTHIYGYFTTTEGDWSAKEAILYNTPEAALVVRVGDIDNLGFGWPSGFDPFSGSATPSHTFPWAVNPEDPVGTDRIMVISSYVGTPPRGRDGYTSSTSRPANNVEPITLTYPLAGQTVNSAAVQMFVDDFQAPVWGANYQVTLNGVRAPFLETIVNSLTQTGPIGKLITAAFPPEFLPLVQTGELAIGFDDPTTGAGDGYAVDFVKLLINVGSFTQVGTIRGTVTETTTAQPVPGVQVSAQGLASATTDANGSYLLENVVAGLVSISASFPDYGTQVKSADLVGGETKEVHFTLTAIPRLRIELLPADQVRLSWPGVLSGFSLQTTSPLYPVDWVNEGSVPEMVNGRHTVVNPVGSAPRFYRLIK